MKREQWCENNSLCEKGKNEHEKGTLEILPHIIMTKNTICMHQSQIYKA